MKTNRTTGYGLVAVAYIAQHCKDGLVLAKRISKEYNGSLKYLLKVLNRLVTANVLISKTGPQGGFSLARPAEEITMLEIIEAIDGPMMKHFSLAEQTSNAPFCLKMDDVCRKATQEMRTVYQKATLSTMLGA